MKYKIGIITPIWKRPELTRVFLDYYADAPVYRRQAILDPSEWYDYGNYASWYGTRVPNEPLADKHNAGMLKLEHTDVDAVCLIPSDDFLSPAYFDVIDQALDAGHDALQLRSFYFYCLQTGRLLRGERLGIGAGFMLRRDVLERVDWQPWPSGANANMDANMFAKCRRHIKNMLEIEQTEDYGFVGVDCKGRTTRNSFQHLWDKLAHKQQIDSPQQIEAFWRTHFPTLAETMLYEHERLAE